MARVHRAKLPFRVTVKPEAPVAQLVKLCSLLCPRMTKEQHAELTEEDILAYLAMMLQTRERRSQTPA